MKKVAIGDFTAAPTEGVKVDTTNENTDRAGLKRGDVFVALDGYRVQNIKQYMLVRALTDDPKINLIVWNGTKYVEVAISLPNRMFNNDISNFRAGGR
jgi:S1-C subfamily serine protease